MGLVLMPNEIKMNMSTLRIYLESATRRYQNVREKVYEYSVNEELTTESYQKSKELMDVCYQLIADGMNAVGESIRGDIDTIRGRIGDEYLNEDILKAQINMLRVQCEQYEAKIRSLQTKKSYASGSSVQGLIESYRAIIENLKEQIAVLQEKLNFLYEVRDSTANLFQSAIGLLAALRNVIADGGVNVDAYNVLYEKLGLPVITEEVKRLVEMEEFRKDLIEQGFPEGYMHYLMILHEKYPEWKFEAVITGIDYGEFARFQESSKVKCGDYNNRPKYCTELDFKKEDDPKYHDANSEAIFFFMNPYSMLQLVRDDYTNAMQFLVADQELPESYIDKVLPAILSKEDEAVISAIKNADSCVNPVFMAAVYSVEDGPKGEEYNGETIYNFFNIGADNGRGDARQYAYDQKWYTLEDCLKGSEEVFQKYLNRGQDTLYAMTWDFNSYMSGDDLKQFSTLVNDAEDKAISMCKRGDDQFNLHYEFTFKIPVYENVEKYGALSDPNHVTYKLEDIVK